MWVRMVLSWLVKLFSLVLVNVSWVSLVRWVILLWEIWDMIVKFNGWLDG